MDFEKRYYELKKMVNSTHYVKPAEVGKRRGVGKLNQLDKMSRSPQMKNSRKYKIMKSKTKVPPGKRYRHL